MAEWSVSGGMVRFLVSAMVTDSEWAAIGFSDDTSMVSVCNSSLVPRGLVIISMGGN